VTDLDFHASALAYCRWAAQAGFPVSMTSSLRSPARNAKVGGHVDSLHQLGLAVDLVYDLEAPALELAQQRASRLGCRLIRESDHDHFQAA